MDDKPMWVADRVVALTLGFAITNPETVNEFSIKALFDRLLREIRAFSQHENKSLTDAWLRMKEMLRNCHGHNLSKGSIFPYKTPNQTYQLLEDKVLLKLDWVKNQKTKSPLKKTIAFADEAINQRFFHRNIHGPQNSTRNSSKNHQALIQNLETKFDRLTDKQTGRPSGSFPSNTQPNPRGNNSKAYQPPQSRNEHVIAVFTRSGKSYDPPDNLNDQKNNYENPINFDRDDEDKEPTPQPKTQPSKPVKETLLPKPYKPKIP
nr:reverse transcriptase domain-containing protein [Tanacetum cinerariifolium]